jgi:hypothetical protein
MLKTHYVKQRPRQRYEDDRGEELTKLESILYSAAPDDTLFTKEVLLHRYIHKERKETTDYSKKHKIEIDVSASIATLVTKGYLKEIHGERLFNFIKSF